MIRASCWFMVMCFAVLMLFILHGCSIWDGLGYATGLKDKCDKYGNAQPPVSVQELRDTWTERFGPINPDCEPWTWNIVSQADLNRICRATNDAGCTDYSGGCPTTFTTQEYAHDRRLAAHEFTHAMLFCMGVNRDPTHLRADLWQAGGFVDTVANAGK